MKTLKPNIIIDDFKLTSAQINSESRSSSNFTLSRSHIKRYFNNLERIDLLDIQHLKALHELFPAYLLKERANEDWELFLAMSRYDRNFHSYVTGCFDNSSPLEFILISFKHRHKDGIKWKTRAGTSPNSTPLVRIYSDDGTIYVIEGHRDALTAVLLGIDFIMIPYAGFRLSIPTYLQNEIKGRNVVFLVEDEKAYNCMINIAEYIRNDANIKLRALGGIESKLDLSDFVQQFNSIKEVLNEL